MRRRRTLVGVAAALALAAAAVAVFLAASARSHPEPTRADYLESVAAVCRVYGPKLDRIRPPDVAEPANVATAAAIANAFHNATGKRIRTLPMTPANVLAALRAEDEEQP